MQYSLKTMHLNSCTLSDRLPLVHKAGIILGRTLGKMMQQLIEKSAELFLLNKLNSFFKGKTGFPRNSKQGQRDLFNSNATCVKKLIFYFCRNMAP